VAGGLTRFWVFKAPGWALMSIDPTMTDISKELIQYPAFFSTDFLASAYDEVSGLLLNRPPITIYGKPTQQPRDVGFFTDLAGLPSYDYSTQKMPSQPLTPALRSMLSKVNSVFLSGYNAVLVNRYNNGDDCIHPHSDDQFICPQNGVIAASYGATRTFVIHDKKTKKKLTSLPLVSGSLVQMCGEDFQHKYLHSVPREKNVHGCRVSFTFRRHIVEEEYERAEVGHCVYDKESGEWELRKRVAPTPVDFAWADPKFIHAPYAAGHQNLPPVLARNAFLNQMFPLFGTAQHPIVLDE
jgi:alkylated DNA repair dioxygenase AlkB